MGTGLIECVPNFSEGRDPEVVERIEAALQGVPGVSVLDRSLDPDHHRAVITAAGEPAAVAEAAVRAVGEAARWIDLNRHRGVHPRMGAADVVPLVPVAGLSLEECAALAHWVGEEIWRRHQVPVYFYGAAARRPGRTNLEDIRRGQFERLREEAPSNPERRPDVGGPGLHPTAGAVAVGARGFLIAYNVNLNTAEVEIARQIARRVRFSSGGFPHVKAMGVKLASRHLAQVSMNLTDFERTPLEELFAAIRQEAARLGAAVADCEVVGLIPRKAFQQAPEFFRRCANFRLDRILENRLESLAEAGALESK